MTDFLRLMVVFLAAINPPAVARALAASPDGPRRLARREAVLGGAVAAVVFAGAAAGADSLLSGLDVEPESFRIAAGAVMTASGLRALFLMRSPARPADADPWWQRAVFPVAVPWLAGAAALVVAVDAGADDRGWQALAGVAVAGVATCALLARLPRVVRGAGGDGLAGLLGALLVVLGAAYVVEGVQSV